MSTRRHQDSTELDGAWITDWATRGSPTPVPASHHVEVQLTCAIEHANATLTVVEVD